MAGVAFLWNMDLNQHVEKLPDGSDRIICISLNTQPKKTCLINTYMPCRGKTASVAAYRQVIDEIYEIITKYTSTHDLYLLGDFNTDITKSQLTPEGTLLNNLLEDFNLQLPASYPRKDTFFHLLLLLVGVSSSSFRSTSIGYRVFH